MRVLHIQKAKGVSGSERHLLALLPGLQARGIEVQMCVLAAGEYERILEPLGESRVEVVVMRSGLDLNPMLIGRIRRAVRQFRPDIVHTHLIHADVHGQVAARLSGVPGVTTIHGTPAFAERPPYLQALRVAGRAARRTIVISEHVRRFVERLRLADPRSIRVIPYGIDVTSWDVDVARRAATRAMLGLRDDDVAICTCSRLIPHKGHDFLLDGLAAARSSAPNVRLVVAGDGPLRRSLEERANRLVPGVATFLGYVHDVRPVIEASDILAFPTMPELSEGFGLAALEAMAMSRPVVATRVGSLPEVVADGETGKLVEPGRIDELAQAVTTLARHPELRSRMGQRGRRRAEERFSLDSMIGSTIQVYRELRP